MTAVSIQGIKYGYASMKPHNRSL